MTLFDPDEFEHYDNIECLDRCDQRHDPPDDPTPGASDTAVWTCPTTGQRFTYEGSPGHGSWEPTNYAWSEPEWLDGANVFTLEPGDYDYTSCCDCGGWVHYDDVRSNEWGDYYYCRECYRYNGHSGTETVARCYRCHDTSVTHYHVLSEELSCSTCATAGPKFLPIEEAA